MAYDAKAIEIMIASPIDVVNERQAVRDVIAEWNAVHSRREAVCLMAVGWETHSSPELAGRPQQIINERVLENADLLVGIFWTRVGSPTGKSISGSVEEIERHLEAGKPAMLYFSTAPVVPSSLDKEQFEALERFKEWAKGQGLIEQFENLDQFRTKFRNQLQLTLNANEHLQRIVSDASTDFVAVFNDAVRPDDAELGDDARALLLAAFRKRNGMIMIMRHLGGTRISAGDESFGEEKDRRSVARWEAAIEQLYGLGYTRDLTGRGESFELTHSGYELAEKFSAKGEGT
jgi:hypothetical protein